MLEGMKYALEMENKTGEFTNGAKYQKETLTNKEHILACLVPSYHII